MKTHRGINFSRVVFIFARTARRIFFFFFFFFLQKFCPKAILSESGYFEEDINSPLIP